jgi:hypothetical protein
MTPEVSVNPRAVANKARAAIAKVRPSPTAGRRSLPIRRPGSEIQRLWDDAAAHETVLDGIPVAESSLELGSEMGAWGTTATVALRLEAAVPGTPTQLLAGKAVRRLKALAETGEVPTTDRNPSAREDGS